MTSFAAGPQSGRRVLIIRNPVAGWHRRARFGRILNALVAAGCLVEVRQTAARGDAEAFARVALHADWDVLAVAGGDGTVNEVVNGMGPLSPPLAILPLGTANVAAHEIGLPFGVEALARLIAVGGSQRIHVGLVNGRRFLAMAGAGFDALVVAGIDPRLKRWIGRGAYVWEIARQLVRLAPCQYTVTVDGQPHAAASVVVANGHYYGGRFTCAPEARLDEAALHVCLFRRSGRGAVIGYLFGLVSGLLPRMPSVRIVRGTRITIAAGAAEPVQGDGDILARLPVEIGVDPSPIAVIASHP